MAATLFDGMVRLVHKSASDIPLNVLISKNFKEFKNVAGTPNTDPQTMPKVKKSGRGSEMRAQEKLSVEYYLNTAATEAASGNALTWDYRIPVTVRDLRTGIVFENTYTTADFTAKQATAASQVFKASVWTVFHEMTIPNQQEVKLGHAVQDVRVDSALNLYANYVA